ncbi:ABC transporter substrate-binding protein [Brevibacillus sp. B_LB10_24]|uniref:ABC transporter substrate-binding protein n=1 Tax=Brevibacillus sp. B_LB10_24 TaxID=3380645 RepID=UPI0038BDC1D4
MKKGLTKVLTVLLGVMLVAGCSGQTGGTSADANAGGSKEYKDQLVIQNVSDLTDLDPAYISGVPTSRIANLLFDHLVRYDKDGQVVGQLAEKWETSEDGKTWTFYLHEGVKYHDGSDLTAEDVKFNFDRIKDPQTASPRASDLEIIDSIEAKDQTTLVFHLKEPFAAFIDKCIIINPTLIASPKALKEYGKDFTSHPVGTGPYKFKEWVTGDKVVLEANPDYYLGAPETKQVVFRVMPDPMTAMIEMENGGLDILQKVLPTEADRIKASDKISLEEAKDYNIRWIFFNENIAPFDDQKVRQALTYAVDRAAIHQSLLAGVADLANGFQPEISWAYEPDTTPYTYDVEKAKSLLKEAGWVDADGDGIVEKDGKKLTVELNVPNGRYLMDKEIMEAVQNQWKQIGVEPKMNIVEWGKYVENVLAKDKYGVYMLGLSQDNPEPVMFLDMQFHSKGSNNTSNYKNEKVDKLLEEARTVVDLNKRKQLYSEAQKLIADDFPVIPLYSEYNLLAVSKKVEGYQHSASTFDITHVKVAK